MATQAGSTALVLHQAGELQTCEQSHSEWMEIFSQLSKDLQKRIGSVHAASLAQNSAALMDEAAVRAALAKLWRQWLERLCALPCLAQQRICMMLLPKQCRSSLRHISKSLILAHKDPAGVRAALAQLRPAPPIPLGANWRRVAPNVFSCDAGFTTVWKSGSNILHTALQTSPVLSLAAAAQDEARVNSAARRLTHGLAACYDARRPDAEQLKIAGREANFLAGLSVPVGTPPKMVPLARAQHALTRIADSPDANIALRVLHASLFTPITPPIVEKFMSVVEKHGAGIGDAFDFEKWKLVGNDMADAVRDPTLGLTAYAGVEPWAFAPRACFHTHKRLKLELMMTAAAEATGAEVVNESGAAKVAADPATIAQLARDATRGGDEGAADVASAADRYAEMARKGAATASQFISFHKTSCKYQVQVISTTKRPLDIAYCKVYTTTFLPAAIAACGAALKATTAEHDMAAVSAAAKASADVYRAHYPAPVLAAQIAALAAAFRADVEFATPTVIAADPCVALSHAIKNARAAVGGAAKAAADADVDLCERASAAFVKCVLHVYLTASSSYCVNCRGVSLGTYDRAPAAAAAAAAGAAALSTAGGGLDAYSGALLPADAATPAQAGAAAAAGVVGQLLRWQAAGGAAAIVAEREAAAEAAAATPRARLVAAARNQARAAAAANAPPDGIAKLDPVVQRRESSTIGKAAEHAGDAHERDIAAITAQLACVYVLERGLSYTVRMTVMGRTDYIGSFQTAPEAAAAAASGAAVVEADVDAVGEPIYDPEEAQAAGGRAAARARQLLCALRNGLPLPAPPARKKRQTPGAAAAARAAPEAALIAAAKEQAGAAAAANKPPADVAVLDPVAQRCLNSGKGSNDKTRAGDAYARSITAIANKLERVKVKSGGLSYRVYSPQTAFATQAHFGSFPTAPEAAAAAASGAVVLKAGVDAAGKLRFNCDEVQAAGARAAARATQLLQEEEHKSLLPRARQQLLRFPSATAGSSGRGGGGGHGSGSIGGGGLKLKSPAVAASASSSGHGKKRRARDAAGDGDGGSVKRKPQPAAAATAGSSGRGQKPRASTAAKELRTPAAAAIAPPPLHPQPTPAAAPPLPPPVKLIGLSGDGGDEPATGERHSGGLGF